MAEMQRLLCIYMVVNVQRTSLRLPLSATLPSQMYSPLLNDLAPELDNLSNSPPVTYN